MNFRYSNIMERLSHDLNLALDESNCARQGRKKFGLRRRTRSTGNLPSLCISGALDECSSGSPPAMMQGSQPLSDSDEPQLNQMKSGGAKGLRGSHLRAGGNFESDSLNENLTPSRPPTARRKRKFKKMAVDCSGVHRPQSPCEMIDLEVNLVPSTLLLQGSSALAQINKKKRIFMRGQDRFTMSPNLFCGKRKWSHRDRSDIGEMRERSFSGGCTSKPYFFGKNFLDFKNCKKYSSIDKVPKFKEKLKAKVPSQDTSMESSLPSFPNTPSLPGSSSFNFVYKSGSGNATNKTTGFKVATYLPPFFPKATNEIPASSGLTAQSASAKPHKSRHCKSKGSRHIKSEALRNPLQFDDPNIVMDCTNEYLSSSSLSSSDSEGVVTNDSDREGDDELTDWPGNEEISSFNKSLNIKTVRPLINGSSKIFSAQGGKTLKKDKFLPKQGISSCKNRMDSIKADTDVDIQLMDDDTMMSDTGSVLDVTDSKPSISENVSNNIFQSNSSFASFSDIKNAGLDGQNTNEAFFHSFQAFQDKSNKCIAQPFYSATPRSNFSLQKTSSSDLNLSEKSPQSDHYFSEHSMGNFGSAEIREIRAGCRRIHEERPGLLILSAANEQLSRFLQDSCQSQLRLPCFNDDNEEKDKLDSLAKLYSLELTLEMGRPVLTKTSKTTQAVRVEQTRIHQAKLLSDYKRRCYGDNVVVESADPTFFPDSITDDWSLPSESLSSSSCLDKASGFCESTPRQLIPPDIAISACNSEYFEDNVEISAAEMHFAPDLLSNVPMKTDFSMGNVHIGNGVNPSNTN